MRMHVFYCAGMLLLAMLSVGAGYRTENFVVRAPDRQLAREIGDAAEGFRRQLAVEWLGRELPRWPQPCPIDADVAPQLPAGGETSFVFHGSQPMDWRMHLQGNRQRVLDSVLPHEVTHTIFATHFGCPLPRWADEGACTTVEHPDEKAKQHRMLIHFLKHQRGIPFAHMFAMRDYPADILPLYSQGYSLARFLIGHGGKQKFVSYVEDGLRSNNWAAATERHYSYRNLSELQLAWLDWVKRGCSPAAPTQQPDVLLVSAPGAKPAPTDASPTPESAGSWYLSRVQRTEGAPRTASRSRDDEG